MRPSDEFRTFSARSEGVFTRARALSNGLTPRQFRTGVANGDWLPYRDVWIMAAVPRTSRTVMRSVVLRAGPDARLTAETALTLYGFDSDHGCVRVSVPETTNRRLPGTVILRDHDRSGTGGEIGGFLVMTRTRSIVGALRIADSRHGRKLLDEVVRRGWISGRELQVWCMRLRGHRGLPALRARLDDLESGTRAESERVLGRIMRGAGIRGWEFNVEIRTPTGLLIGVGDCVNVELQIVVEVDGWAWHTSADRFQRDRTRQNQLVHAGWAVLRFTWTDLTERPANVIAAIKEEIARAGATNYRRMAKSRR